MWGMRRNRVLGTASTARLDIQGIRAFAVLVVILDHLFAWPKGGFVGVDIFFVVSGFLITGQLVREWERTSRISFVDFYKRRVKRILPAATLALVGTIVASFLLLSNSRAREILWDGTWSALFAANWRFAAAGTDYFQSDGPISPLQHFWSLAVEEQFYFVWPWVMLLSLLVMSKLGRNTPRTVAGIAIGVITLGSFTWALSETSSAPTLAYFSSLSRAWELGFGALLAVAVPLLTRIPDGIRPWLAWAGIVGMVASVFVLSDDVSFPAPGAALPVLAVGAVIAAGVSGGRKYLFPLTNPVAGHIGNLSFSLYLWHFPAIVLLSVFFPDGGALYYIMVLVSTTLLAIYAYVLVEDPIRRSTWLTNAAPKGLKSSRRRRRSSRRRSDSGFGSASYNLTAVSLLAVVAIGLCAVALAPSTQQQQQPAPAAALAAYGADGGETAVADQNGPEVATLQKELTSALAATTWPQVTPTFDEAIGSAQAKPEVAFCGMPTEFSLKDCTIGTNGAQKKAVLLGNSAAMTFATPLRDALGADWSLVVNAAFGCPYSAVFVPSADPAVAADCKARNSGSAALIQNVQPDAIFIIDSYTPHQAEGESKAMTAQAWAKAVASAIQPLQSTTSQVVLLSPPPRGGTLAECFNNISSPSQCVYSPAKYWYDVRSSESEAAKTLGATYVDTLSLFCAAERCPAFAGSTPMKSDGTHMTTAYGEKVTSALRELLQAAGVAVS